MTTTVHYDARVKHARAGFTLMEILIAVMILGLLSAMIGPALFNVYKKQQKNATRGTLRSMKIGIERYQQEVHQLPVTLKDLIKKPKSSDERVAKRWDGPYVGKEGDTDIPEDPWDGKFVYKITQGAKHPYELYSYGPNGKGSPKDQWISVWDE
jgi:general secretion pathway protein G